MCVCMCVCVCVQGRIQDLARGGAQIGQVVGGWGEPAAYSLVA